VELRQLRYFVAVAEQRHFGRAAEQLRIVPSAVSQQIRRLERELGTALFRRSTRRVELTDAGRVLLDHATALLTAADTASTAVRRAGPCPVPEIRIGTCAGLGDLLSEILTVFRRHHDIAAELVHLPEHQRVAAVRDGTLDAAFIRHADEAGPRNGIRTVRLAVDHLVAALPVALTTPRRLTVALNDLAAVPVRIPREEHSPALVRAVLAACHRAGFEPPRARAAGAEDMLTMIANGRPTWTVFYPARATLLAARPITGVAFRRVVSPTIAMATSLVTSADREDPIIGDLIAAALDASLTRRTKP
jgi:DNA-binding transcriptional LysR family regulator